MTAKDIREALVSDQAMGRVPLGQRLLIESILLLVEAVASCDPDTKLSTICSHLSDIEEGIRDAGRRK